MISKWYSAKRISKKPYVEAFSNMDIWMKHNCCLFAQPLDKPENKTFLSPAMTVTAVWISVS